VSTPRGVELDEPYRVAFDDAFSEVGAAFECLDVAAGVVGGVQR